MKAMVTGATGFVGAAVARALLARGWAVRALTRPGSDTANLDDLDIERVPGDVTDAASVARATAGCTHVFHVAADYRLWVPDPARMRQVNVDGTRNVLRAAADAGVERLVHTSSVATLGLHADGRPSDERTEASTDDMIGPYKRTKFDAEREAARWARDEGLPVVIVNPSTPIGPGDVKPTPTGRMVLDAISGRMPAFVDTGLNIVHVDDVAEGHLLAMTHGVVGERYVLGGENLVLRDILARLARLSGRRPPRVRLPHGLVLPIAHAAEAVARRTGREPRLTVTGIRLAKKHMFFSSQRARRELGYAPRPADAALADAVAWFREHAART